MRAETIRDLVIADAKKHDPDGTRFGNRAIFHIWPDFPISTHTNKSISTVKADAARAGVSAGSGLGLSIVKSIVERQGGSVSVRTKPGQTVFEIDGLRRGNAS